MKKRLFAVTLVLAILGIMCITVAAKSEFVVENNTLISYTGNDKNVVIPSEVDGEAIIFIDRFAFDSNDYIETVTISEGVEIINSEAFKNCYNLKTVVVPESLMDICAYAFSGCYELEPVELKSEWTTINDDAYVDADRNAGIMLMTLDDYVMNGGTIVAYNGTDTELVIPDTIDGVTVTEIGASAFQGNTMITSVTIPDTVKTIGKQAFYNCSGIKTLKLSENLTQCYSNAFANCTSLTEVTIPGSLKKTGVYMFYNCTGLKSAVVEEGVQMLSDSCFRNCSNLLSLTLPESLENISTYAVSYCAKIPYIDIPDNLKNIGDAAFYYCNAVNDVVIPDTVTYMGTHSFRGCWKLSNIKLSKGGTEIRYRTFHNCAIKTLDIPDNYTAIGIEAFWYCSKLENIELPPAIKSIGSKAFYNCPKLEEITTYGNLTSIGTNIFGTLNGSLNTTVNVYAPETSAMYAYAGNNNIARIPIVCENVAIIVGEDSLGTYGTINYPITDRVDSIGMNYIPEHLADNAEAPVLDIVYEDIDVENGNTFMTLMTDVDSSAMNWEYIATPYIKLKDGTLIWGNGKTFSINDITTVLTWEE